MCCRYTVIVPVSAGSERVIIPKVPQSPQGPLNTLEQKGCAAAQASAAAENPPYPPFVYSCLGLLSNKVYVNRRSPRTGSYII